MEFLNYVCPQLQWPRIFFATIILCTVFPRVVKGSTALHVTNDVTTPGHVDDFSMMTQHFFGAQLLNYAYSKL